MRSSTPISVANEGFSLHGELLLPRGTGPAPVVVVAHGASEGIRDAPIYRHLIDRLVPRGVGVALYDRRTEPDHTGHITPQLLTSDLRAVIGWVREQAGVDAARLGLWGHSQGCWLIAAVAAADPAVHSLMAVSPSGSNPADQMKYAVQNLLAEAAFDRVAQHDARLLQIQASHWELGELSTEDFAAAIGRASHQPWFPLTHLSRPVEGAQRAAAAWSNLDVTSDLRRINVPIAVVLGAKDRWIDVEESGRVWRSSAQGGVRLLDLAESGHYPTFAADPSDWLERGAWHPEYEALVDEWADLMLASVVEG